MFSGALSRASGENVGSYAISQGTLSAGGNYTIAFTGANFAITPATLTYVANSASRTYGGTNPTFDGTVTGLVNGDTLASATTGALSFDSPATASSNVGSYAINGSGLTANNGNYVFAQAAANATALTINPATLTYVANAGSITVGSDIPTLSWNGDRLCEWRHTGECNERHARLHNYSDKVESRRCLRDRRFRAVCGQLSLHPGSGQRNGSDD